MMAICQVDCETAELTPRTLPSASATRQVLGWFAYTRVRSVAALCTTPKRGGRFHDPQPAGPAPHRVVLSPPHANAAWYLPSPDQSQPGNAHSCPWSEV